jgi:K+ transporter
LFGIKPKVGGLSVGFFSALLVSLTAMNPILILSGVEALFADLGAFSKQFDYLAWSLSDC